jgi:hypothetical protein
MEVRMAEPLFVEQGTIIMGIRIIAIAALFGEVLWIDSPVSPNCRDWDHNDPNSQ